jgi:hypothetical protein
VHAGFAIQKWSEQDMDEYREIMREMGQWESKVEGRKSKDAE